MKLNVRRAKAIKVLRRRLAAAEALRKKINTEHAEHSPTIDPLMAHLWSSSTAQWIGMTEEALEHIFPGKQESNNFRRAVAKTAILGHPERSKAVTTLFAKEQVLHDALRRVEAIKTDSFVARVLPFLQSTTHQLGITIVGGILATAGAAYFFGIGLPPTSETATVLESASSSAASSLRTMTDAESFEDAEDLPNGIVAFVSAKHLFYNHLYPTGGYPVLGQRREGDNTFELRKLHDEYFLIGYVDDGSLLHLDQASSSTPLALRLIPQPWLAVNHGVSIPLSAITTIVTKEKNLAGSGNTIVLDLETTNITVLGQ